MFRPIYYQLLNFNILSLTILFILKIKSKHYNNYLIILFNV